MMASVQEENGNESTSPDPGDSAGVVQPKSERTFLSQAGRFIAKDIGEHILLDEHNLRRETADRIIGLFIKLNAATLAAFFLLFFFDIWLIKSGSEKPAERLIDGSVVKMLIGATTVQLGAAVALVIAYLFPGTSRNRRI